MAAEWTDQKPAPFGRVRNYCQSKGQGYEKTGQTLSNRIVIYSAVDAELYRYAQWIGLDGLSSKINFLRLGKTRAVIVDSDTTAGTGNQQKLDGQVPLETTSSADNITITQAVIAGGGGTTAGGNFRVSNSLGQSIVGEAQGGRFSIGGGLLGEITVPMGQPCPPITIAPLALPNGQLGQPYIQQLAQTGGVGPIAWTITGALPNGLTLNASTGLLSGTPVASGSFAFTVKVTDGNGCPGTQGYTLVIGCPIIAISPTILPNAVRNQSYSQALTATGGTPNYTFSFDGTSPSGLSLSANGTLTGSGTYPAGVTSLPFSVKVADAGGCMGTQSYTLPITTPPYTVSGRVVDLTGNGIAGVTMAFSNSFGTAGSTQTDANGNWTQSGFNPVTTPSSCTANPYVVKPSKSGYSFNPVSQTFCDASSALNFTGAPVVTSVSAASFLAQELAQESIVAAFGANLATKVETATTVPLPTTLAGTTVKVKDTAGMERNAPLFFVAPNQVNYQIPPGTAVGQAAVTVTSGDNKISIGTITVSSVAPGLLSANATGQGLPAAVVLRIRNGVQTFDPVSRFDTAQNGNVAVPIDLGPESDVVYLLLYGVGIRNRTKAEAISVNLGGLVKVLDPAKFEDGFAATGFIGLDQVNVLLPRSLAGLGNINVSLTVDGKLSNTVQLNIK